MTTDGGGGSGAWSATDARILSDLRSGAEGNTLTDIVYAAHHVPRRDRRAAITSAIRRAIGAGLLEARSERVFIAPPLSEIRRAVWEDDLPDDVDFDDYDGPSVIDLLLARLADAPPRDAEWEVADRQYRRARLASLLRNATVFGLVGIALILLAAILYAAAHALFAP